MSEKRDPINNSATGQANACFDFVSSFSHDVKSPISAIKLFTDIMQSDLDSIDTATQQKYLSIIKARADDLNFLLSNAQDYHKIQLQKMEWREEKHNLYQLIRKASFPAQVSCQTKNIEFNFDYNIENLILMIDGDRFCQIIYNLLAYILNHIEKGQIYVTLFASKTSPDLTLTISSRLNEKGIAKLKTLAQPNHLTDKLEVCKLIDTMLYVAKHLITHYQGKTHIETSPHNETQFKLTFSLPRC